LSAQRKANGAQGRRPANGRARSRKAVKPKRSLPRRLLRWGLLAGLVAVILGAAAFAYGYMATDIPDPNKDFQAQTTFVYYADGHTQVGKFATQNRVSVPLSDVPRHVQDAVIAAEDRSFYTNRGIDPKGIIRAAFSNARGNATQGASTITQQYVKIFYLSSERTLSRKVKEAFLSLKLQQQQSKQEILQGYLNTIYFGRGAYGVQAAAQAYFDKDVEQLSVREGAALAAILNSPENYDPADGKDAKERLRERYEYVLEGMDSMGTLPADVVAKAERKLPRFPDVPQGNQYGGQRGYLMDMVKKELRAEGFSDSEIEGGGLRVTTTFMPKVMRAANQAVMSQRPPGLKQLHVAVASVDPKTGALRGFFAGQDYLKSNGGINWAVAGGSPGSAFKPFALAAGIKDGFSLKSTFDGNSPYVYPNGVDKVVNEGPGDGNDYGSAISLLKATEDSVNTAYIDLTESMEKGPQKILDMAADMGVPRDAPGLNPGSGISLGSATINPIDMANAYGTIADGGQAKDWFVISRVKSATGDELYKKRIKTGRVLDEDVDRDVSYALQQVVKNGTGQNAQALGRPAAGKTGTATNAKGEVSSSWFVGYTPQLSTAVMYVRGDGNDALNGYMPSYFGADYPTRTWTETMRIALDGQPVEDFPPPANVKATTKIKGHEPAPTFTPRPTPTKKPSRTPSQPPTTLAPPTTTAPPTATVSSPPPSSAGTICLPPTCPSQSPSNGGGNGGGGGGGNGLASRPPDG
jgi:membrane peptidoglycan carboxypeptidase